MNAELTSEQPSNTPPEPTTAPAGTGTTVAYAYRSGLIEFATPIDGSAIPKGTLFIAHGETERVVTTIQALARRAYDKKTLLIPGCPEAATEASAREAFTRFFERVQSALGPHSNVRAARRARKGTRRSP